MKANFNIVKNVRNSRSISALSTLRKLQSLGLLLCALMIGSLQVWGADEVYKTAKFGSSYNSGGVSSYTASWSSTNDGFTVNIANGNNNNNGWNYVKFGRKNYTSVGTIITDAKIDKAVTKVTLTISAITATTTNSIKLYTSSNNSTWTEAGSFTKSSGAQTVELASPTANLYYKIEFDCASGSGNGFITVTQVDYYITSGPTLYTVTFDANGGSVTPASATQASAGAAVTLPTPTRSGYNCTGWYTATSGGTKRGDAGGSYTPTASETIHAQWSAKTYSNYRTLCAAPEDPAVTLAPTSITGLNYIVGSGPSTAQSFVVKGSNLTGALTVTPNANYEICLTNSATPSDWKSGATTLSISEANAEAVAGQTVYVRLKSGLSVGDYNSQSITISGGGLASNATVTVSGSVFKPTIIATPASVSWNTSIGVAPTTQSVTITGTNLKGDISVTLNGTDASSFSIGGVSSIAQATAEGAGGTITITYTGSYAATATKTANIQLTASDATTVNVPITFNVIVDPNLYFLTDLEDIGPKDKVIIVSSKDVGGASEVDYALKNATTTSTYPPDAVDVEDMIAVGRATLSYSGTDLQWNINYNSVSREFTINRDGDDDVFLYCIDNNKGLSVGTTGTNNAYVIDDDYIKSSALTRYLGVYNDGEWRTYTSNGGNIADQTFTFYVQKSTDPYVTLGSSFTEFTYEYNHGPSAAQSFTVSGEHLSANLVVTAPSNYQVCKTVGGTYTSSVSFTPSTGTVSEQTVYIRLAAGLAVGEYDYAQSGGLSVTSTGADPVKAALEGSVTPESFTVTATSSNVSHGSVSPASQSTTTNMTITASPLDGYRVVSGAGGYTVTTGTASVVNNGDNTFTVTPSTDCTVRINFEAIPTHKVTYWATGTKVQESDVREGAAIPDQTTETASAIEAYCGNREHFVGWTTTSGYSHATDAPAGMITTMSPGGTMSTSDVNYYAVFANTGGTSTSFSRVTSLSQLADGDVIAIVAEQSGGQIFSTSTDHKGGSAPTETEGKITVSASTNTHTLEAVESNWKICKDASNKLATTLSYAIAGNTFSIVNAETSNYFYIKYSGGNSWLEYYSNKWQMYNTLNNSYMRLKIYKQDPGYVDYTTECCSLQPVTDVVVNSMTNTSVTLGWTLPASTAGITKFQVIDVDNGNAVVKDNISTSATNSGSISGLTKCNTYHYKVVSYSSTCTVTSSAIEFRPFGDARTVNFNYNGGTGTPASFTTSCDGTSTTLPTPDVRDGYTFLGWWSASSGGDKRGEAGDSYTVTGNTTIWAHWAQNFTVTYNRRGGTIVCGGSEIGVAGQTFTICTTEPTRSGYIFAGWDTEEGGTGTRYNAGGTFTMPSSDVTLYAQWTANWRNLTFNVPEGAGSATGVPSGSHVLDGQSFTMPTITGKSDSKWCWTFLGWTETAPNGSGTWATTPSYIAGGATSGAITSNKTYYAVYSKTGAGASGTVELTTAVIDGLYQAKLSEAVSGAIAYGNERSYTSDGYTWTTTTRQMWINSSNQHSTYLQFNTANTTWLKLPTLPGPISSMTIDCRNASGNALATGSVYLRTSPTGSNEATGTISSNTCTFGETELTTGYLVAAQNMQILSMSISYGPPAIYGYTLDDCGCVVTEFDLTYDANTANFAGSTITPCTGVTGYKWSEHDDEYTICSTVPTCDGYKFSYWATNANGSGTHYNPGEVITCVGETPITLYARYERVHTVTFNNQGTPTPVTQASAGAAIDVPAATTPCSAEWTFAGWSKTAIAPMSLLPELEITAGTSTYTPDEDVTLYAIYRKTSTSSAFVAGMSGAYKIKATYNATDQYATDYNGAKLRYSATPGAAQTYYIKYVAADGGKYTIQQSDGQYIKYQGKPATSGAHTDLALSATEYFWRINASGSLWAVQATTSTDANTHYLQFDPNGSTGFKGYTNGINIAFVAADGQYYYRTMSCEDDFDIIFHENGTTINWATGYPEATYKDLANATIISTFPTATFDGWTFLGWRTADYEESTDAPASASVYGGTDGISGNTITVASANIDLYPVFTRFEDNEPFDQINGGDYYIYFLESGSDDGYGAEKRVYAGTYADKKRYNSTALCSAATTFTFTKLDNGNWTIYDNTTNKYLYGIADDDLAQKTTADGAEWTLTVNGNQFDAFHVGTSYGQLIAQGDGTSATIMNYRRTNVTTNPAMYHRVYLGSCTNRVFSSNPSTIPEIDLKGTVVVTASQNGAVRNTNVLTVSGHNLTPSTGEITITSNNSDVYFSLSTDKNFAKGVADQPKTSVTITANGSGIVTPTPVYVHYKPSSNTDTWTSATITASYTDAEDAEVTAELRTVKENFVIASKVGDNWYALPANMAAEGVFEPVLIDVDESAKIAYGPATVGYKMWPVQTVNGGTDEYAANGDKVRFAGNSNAGLWASNSNNHIRNWATITAIGSTAETPASYEWIIETEDREAYTLKSMYSTNYLDLYRPSSGAHAGKLVWASNSTYETNEIHFFPLTEREVINIIPREWKTTGLVFSVAADNQITAASYKIGTGSETSTTYTRHSTGGYGLYEVALPDLTSQYGKLLTLKLTISGTPTYATTTIPIIVNADKSTKTDEPFATLGAATKDYDVVVLDGKTLTTDAIASGACKFQNLYLYAGSTLVNAANNNLSVRYLELRGGIKGIDHKSDLAQGVPHLKLDKNFTSTAGANLDMVVNTAHSYALSVPFDVTLSTVNFANFLNPRTNEAVAGALDAQFLIMEYDGEQRATTGGTGWKHITSTSRTLHAGEGYVLQAKRPKGQPFGVIRFPFSSVSGWADGSGEVTKSAISISAHEGGDKTPDNDKGWNLIANPYMANVSYVGQEESSFVAKFTVGQLIKTDTNPWDGKYQFTSKTNAYVTMPNDAFSEFPQYRANTVTFEPFKNFFIQASADGDVTFERSYRAAMPRYLMAESEKAEPVYADINLTHDAKTAQAGITIDANAAEGYKFGEDQNIFESREALTYLKMYTIADGHYLVGNTLTPTEAEQLIPLEFYAPDKNSEYVFSLSETSDIEQLEYVMLYDAEGSNTDLLHDTYTIVPDKEGLIENRFMIGIRAKKKEDTATGAGGVEAEGQQPLKFLHEEKIYILRNGILYDATGKKVREINK